MTVRKRKRSWYYDFTLEGFGRHKKAGFRTKAEAEEAEKRKRDELRLGRRRFTLAQAFEMYLNATKMKDRSRDTYRGHWRRNIEPVLGHYYIEEVDTSSLDELKLTLPDHLAPKSVNHRVKLVGTVLRFMWKRGHLQAVPHVPAESVPDVAPDWYTESERDRLLAGIFEMYPQWYAFFYLTTRLGLRRGEVYAISRDRVREVPPLLVVDRAVQEGYKERRPKLITRKNNRVLTLGLPTDVMDAIRWHIRQGYSGPEFLFSNDGTWPQKVNDHEEPLRDAQKALGLRILSHHKIGRHSVASQAATGGQSIKTIQAQLGHRSSRSTDRYAHLSNGAQLRLVESLKPEAPPHQHRHVPLTSPCSRGGKR